MSANNNDNNEQKKIAQRIIQANTPNVTLSPLSASPPSVATLENKDKEVFTLFIFEDKDTKSKKSKTFATLNDALLFAQTYPDNYSQMTIKTPTDKTAAVVTYAGDLSATITKDKSIKVLSMETRIKNDLCEKLDTNQQLLSLVIEKDNGKTRCHSYTYNKDASAPTREELISPYTLIIENNKESLSFSFKSLDEAMDFAKSERFKYYNNTKFTIEDKRKPSTTDVVAVIYQKMDINADMGTYKNALLRKPQHYEFSGCQFSGETERIEQLQKAQIFYKNMSVAAEPGFTVSASPPPPNVPTNAHPVQQQSQQPNLSDLTTPPSLSATTVTANNNLVTSSSASNDPTAINRNALQRQPIVRSMENVAKGEPSLCVEEDPTNNAVTLKSQSDSKIFLTASPDKKQTIVHSDFIAAKYTDQFKAQLILSSLGLPNDVASDKALPKDLSFTPPYTKGGGDSLKDKVIQMYETMRDTHNAKFNPPDAEITVSMKL